MADIRPTPEQRPIAGGLARLLQRADKFARAPFGYENPPAAMVSDFLSIPPLYRTLENYAYGSPLASGTSSVSRYLPRLSEDTKGAIEGAINLAPMVGPAARATTAGATALGRLGERAAARAVPQIMERRGVGADLLSALASGTTSNVIKPKGGNWLAGHVERALEPLKSADEDTAVRAMLRANPNLDPETARQFATADASISPQNRAINRWIDTKLANYIRNEMGTLEDPVRALAERNVLHVNPNELNYRFNAYGKYPQPGQEFVAASDAAKMWEGTSDNAINVLTAGQITRPDIADARLIAKNPWLTKLSPETNVYATMGADTLAHDLGFPHLIDELKAAMSPASDLPMHLRLDPKDIDKVTVPQAVERVSKINAWRAEQAAKAEKAGMMENLQAAPRLADENLQLSFVEKPGGAWVDIPETVNEKGIKLCTSIGKAGGWCTKNEGLAKDYGSGENRLATLLDAEGRPHAQAKITSIVEDESAFDAVIDDLTPAQDAAWEAHFGARRGPPELTDALEWMQTHAPNVYKKYQDILASQPKGPPDITELKPPGNTFNSDRAREYAKRDPDYKAKVTGSVLNFLNSGEWGRVADLHHYDIVDLKRDSTMLQAYLGDILPHKLPFERKDLFNAAIDANPDLPRFVTPQQLRDLVRSIEPPGYAEGGYVQGYGVGGAVKSFAKLVRSYLAGEGKAATAVAEAAPKEQKMLMGVYRGYAGEAPGETVYHAGAEFARPNPGLFTNPERGAVEQFQRSTGAPKLHTFEAKPRRVGSDEDVYAMARRLGIYEPGVPAGQYLEQGENAIFPQSRLMVEELRNQGLDSLRLKDGMGKQPSLIVLDPAVVRPAVEIFASPQRRVADYYAQRRAAETGQAPHAEMLLVDPFAGEQYGHSTLGTGKNPPMITRARKLKPEDVVDRTQLYAKGGAVDYDPDEIARLAASVVPGYAAGGLVDYDPTEIDTIVSQLKEEFHG